MIIVDTNELHKVGATGALAHLLRAVAADAGLQLAVSAVTFFEYEATKERHYATRIEKARKEHEALRATAGEMWDPPEFEYPDSHELTERDTKTIARNYEILEIEPSAVVEAMRRESAVHYQPQKTPKKDRVPVMWSSG